MTEKLRVVAVSGSLHDPSKTGVLIDEILRRLGQVLDVETHVIRITDVGPQFAGVLNRADLPRSVEDELRRVETADLLVVATPVYRASFTGLFKHFFDFVDQYALVDTPVLLAATGGSERHSLIVEHQLRPLFGFFQALTLPVGVYAHESDFDGYAIDSPLLVERIKTSIGRGLPLITSSVREKARIRQTLDQGEQVEATVAPQHPQKPVRLFS
ncbi:FMN reductase [Planctomonas sp. JC2975]|uniref:FMN reductase n=1 Tax=Planctomonas sp. JC2975 TaxID=2729626 RepID=UPI00147641A8|nr:FMN reductase [Planctomonas sp. JC2975]NNC11463.1 FMN reductase [Planctomonas sp. JC2975]